jgi:hypothetical protein
MTDLFRSHFLLWCCCFFVFHALAPYEAVAVDKGQLTVKVVDDASGQSMPARLSLQASDGSFPGDRIGATSDRWPNIEAHGVFIPGEATFDLPAGKTAIIAAHGLEYKAESRTVDVQAGKKTLIEIRLKRAVNMKELGWLSGDLHVHMIHGEMQRETSYEDVALTCAANGLDFVSVGQEYVGAGQLDLDGYKAKCKAASTDKFQVFLGGERPKNILGHQVILGCDNPFVISEEPPYFKTAGSIHAQGGISVYVHPTRYYPGKQYGGEWLDFPGNNLARELIFDAYAGPSFDGLSVLSDEPSNPVAYQLWFNLLNRGFFVPVFADSDACFDRPMLGLKTPGFWHTYFYLGPGVPITQEALCDAVRKGRTMATTGPLLQFQIEGQISGATLPLDGKTRKVTIKVHSPQHSFSLLNVDSKTQEPSGISKVELIRNGQVIKQWQPNSTDISLEHTIEEKESCWYAVRALGSDERWQVALASPIYFASQPVLQKREPREPVVRGRIYDFKTGKDRKGAVEIRRNQVVLQRLIASGEFTVKMPLDAEIVVHAEGERAITKNLLMDYGPIHRFLWNLESGDLGKSETLDRFEFLTRNIELEFPLGQRMPGCYVAAELEGSDTLDSVKVVEGPKSTAEGTVAVAAILTDTEQIAPGDTMQITAIFRDEGSAASCGPYVVEARAYDPTRPTAFGALKKFASFEKSWDGAKDLGDGYKLISGPITVAKGTEKGPVDWIDLSIRARQGNGDAAFVGLAIPLGPTKRALTLISSWPTMPISWPDRSYGIGPLKICNRIGRKAQPKSDYRALHLSLAVDGRKLELSPDKDGRGCEDAEDAMYTGHYLDQVLNDESKLVAP